MCSAPTTQSGLTAVALSHADAIDDATLRRLVGKELRRRRVADRVANAALDGVDLSRFETTGILEER